MEVRSPDTTTMTEASWDWRPREPESRAMRQRPRDCYRPTRLTLIFGTISRVDKNVRFGEETITLTAPLLLALLLVPQVLSS